MSERVSWHDYFLALAQAVSRRATCPRASVGVVLVRDSRIIATGYNGALAGEPHCTEVGCDMVNGHCQRAVHAEVNAVAQAAQFGIAVGGATLYEYDSLLRTEPCPECRKVVKAAGISAIIVYSL